MRVDFAFLDSGTGGLPYLKYLKDKNPQISCIYVGDTKNFPYGEKTDLQIIEKSSECVKKIIEKWNPRAIVIACNTISVTALEELRKRFPSTPFIGTVPAIKPASAISKTRKIGLLATNATVNHPYTKRLISDFASDCKIFSRGDPELISFIEHNFNSATEKDRLAAVKPAVDYFRECGCDSIVLACTHFLNMTEYFKKAAGSSISIVDSREGVVNHSLEVLKNVCGKNNQSEEEKSFRQKTGVQNDESRLFVTGFTEKNDIQVYENFCQQNGIKFGGILE